MAKTKYAIIDDRMGRKKFEQIRTFVRDLFVNGFRDRNGLNALAGENARAADESRQIIASILHDYYRFEKKGSNRYLLAIDTREQRHNPLHNVWKSKTFTAADIIFYFNILDYLEEFEDDPSFCTRDRIFGEISRSVAYDEEIILYVDDEEEVNKPRTYEGKDGAEKELSKILTRARCEEKLTELTELGILQKEKKAKKYVYSISPRFDIDSELLDFASETMPVSTVGSYLLDRQDAAGSVFTFKHNKISQVLDDDVMYMLFRAMHERREVVLQTYNRDEKKYYEQIVVPLIIVRNVQTGRQYLACWSDRDSAFRSLRLDYIRIEKTTENKGRYMLEQREDFEELKEKCRGLYRNSWGVSLFNADGMPKNASFTISVGENQEYIARRMYRECRNGKVENLGGGKYRFSAGLYDPMEMLPWIATFYGYITELDIEDERSMEKLRSNFREMLKNHPMHDSGLEAAADV